MTAARTGSAGAVKALLANGARVDAKDDRRGQTALMWAAAEGHAAIVEDLIEAGADLKQRVPSGFTPLLFAVREGATASEIFSRMLALYEREHGKLEVRRAD